MTSRSLSDPGQSGSGVEIAREAATRAVEAQHGEQRAAGDWRPDEYADAAVGAFLDALLEDLPEAAVEAGARTQFPQWDAWPGHSLHDHYSKRAQKVLVAALRAVRGWV